MRPAPMASWMSHQTMAWSSSEDFCVEGVKAQRLAPITRL